MSSLSGGIKRGEVKSHGDIVTHHSSPPKRTNPIRVIKRPNDTARTKNLFHRGSMDPTATKSSVIPPPLEVKVEGGAGAYNTAAELIRRKQKEAAAEFHMRLVEHGAPLATPPHALHKKMYDSKGHTNSHVVLESATVPTVPQQMMMSKRRVASPPPPTRSTSPGKKKSTFSHYSAHTSSDNPFGCGGPEQFVAVARTASPVVYHQPIPCGLPPTHTEPTPRRPIPRTSSPSRVPMAWAASLEPKVEPQRGRHESPTQQGAAPTKVINRNSLLWGNRETAVTTHTVPSPASRAVSPPKATFFVTPAGVTLAPAGRFTSPMGRPPARNILSWA